jgi:hypothetical protein
MQSPTTVQATHGVVPLTTLCKFNGEQWEEFISYFKSLATAHAWSKVDKLTYLLASVEGKPRMYTKAEVGVPHTYTTVRDRLQHRYGQFEPAFNVRNLLRDAVRRPGETLEDFVDRLQEIATRGHIDVTDRNELFYGAFIRAIQGTPKMQLYVEQAHSQNRDLTLSDLLALVRRYRNLSPTTERRTVAANTVAASTAAPDMVVAVDVCQPISKRKGELSHTDSSLQQELEEERGKVINEKEEKLRQKRNSLVKDMTYCLNEIAWIKKVIKDKKLHHGMRRQQDGTGNRVSGQSNGAGRGGGQRRDDEASRGQPQAGAAVHQSADAETTE